MRSLLLCATDEPRMAAEARRMVGTCMSDTFAVNGEVVELIERTATTGLVYLGGEPPYVLKPFILARSKPMLKDCSYE